MIDRAKAIQSILELSSKIQRSINYRFVYNYCNLLRTLKQKRSPDIEWKPLDSSFPRFVSIVYEADVPLLAYSLKYLMAQVEKRPRFWLIGDSDAAYSKLKSWLFDSAPPDVEFWHWENLLKELDPKYQIFIKTWVNSGKWGGYAKRFAITLAANARSDILIFDGDVLWFGDFPSTLQALRQKTPTILVGKDYGRAYDSEVARVLGDPRILEEEPLNCGIVYYPKGILLEILTPEKLMNLLTYAERATNHLEQTIIAYAFWQSGGNWFDFETVATTMIDQLKFSNGVKSLARHYAGAKHLFWRDA